MTPSPVFLDTSGWIALVDGRQEHHAAALRFWDEVGRRQRPFVLTDWVVAESGNGLSHPRYRSSFLSLLADFLNYPRLRFVFITKDRLDRATELYAARPDKEWGLVDCASFVVMADLGCRDALTADHPFEQAGFRAVLGRSSSKHRR